MALKLGDKAIDFRLPGVDGKTHDLGEYQDKPVVVVTFWCNHCPYVQAWEPRVLEAQRDYATKGVQFVAINANETVNYPTDDFPHMVERAKAKAYNFPYLRDESQEIARAYGATRTPELFVFDKDRRLRYHGATDDNHESAARVTKRYLRDALDAVLAGRDPPLPETPPRGCSVKWAA
jgi:peroxiredoxin